MSDDDLNLSGWIERRKRDVGPYSDVIIDGARKYEARIEELEAENADLKAKLAKAVGALDRIAHASDVYGVEANAEDYGADTLAYAHKSTCNLARAALAELTSSVAADDEVKGGKDG